MLENFNIKEKEMSDTRLTEKYLNDDEKAALKRIDQHLDASAKKELLSILIQNPIGQQNLCNSIILARDFVLLADLICPR
ncbi:MAG: hypothetical protein J7M24_00145 [Candidatus Latescibacteria bacterium]|nr:hypothetical protein [Candidatus Latescibacterota bacterium]